MSKRILMACLTALVFSTPASAVTFMDPQFVVTAIALADGPPGFDTQSSPPSEAPVSASADSLGATDVATAGAIGGAGLLTASADVSAASGIASAVATSEFSGSFLNPGPVTMSIDFSLMDFASGSGLASTSLFVSVTSNGATLFQDYISGPWVFEYLPAVGTTSALALTLASEVSAGFPEGIGDAAGFGLVSFAVSAVPDAATWLLFSIGLGVLAVSRRGTRHGPSVG